MQDERERTERIFDKWAGLLAELAKGPEPEPREHWERIVKDIRADERAKVIHEILSLGCEACGILLSECGRCQDIRALLLEKR